MSEDRAPGVRSLLADPAIRAILAVELLSAFAAMAVTTALGWQLYQRTRDPFSLAILGIAEFVPAALLALPAGHAADRHDRRRIALFGLLALTVVCGLLAAEAASGERRAWPLYALACVAGATHAFVSPAFTPLLAAAVPAADLSRAVSLASIAWQAATILGPAVAGFLQITGDPAPYLFAGATALAAAMATLRVPRAIGLAHVGDEHEEASFAAALDGLRLIVRTPALVGAITLDLVAVLLGGAYALIPIFATDILDVGALGNGFLRAAPGVGAVLAGVVLAIRPLRRRVGPTLFVAVAAYGVFTVAFGVSTSFAVSLAALAALAGADMVSVTIRSTLGPLLTPPALRGRVGATERVFIGASNELGAFEAGLLAGLVGAVPAVVFGGAASVLVAAVWAWRFRSLRAVDRFEDIEPAILEARR